jgi:hypothetical protein
MFMNREIMGMALAIDRLAMASAFVLVVAIVAGAF